VAVNNTRKTTWIALLALAGLNWPLASVALEVQRADAVYAEQQYRLDLTLTVTAPLARVESVLRDYARYPTLDERILEAKVLERIGEHRVLLFTKLRACFGLICRTVKRVEQVDQAANELVALVIPERSDMRAGMTRTVLTADGDRTHISYVTHLAPNFWVPSVLGRPMMLRTLREASIELFRNVERQAATQ
jgi:hypothetical protein